MNCLSIERRPVGSCSSKISVSVISMAMIGLAALAVRGIAVRDCKIKEWSGHASGIFCSFLKGARK